MTLLSRSPAPHADQPSPTIAVIGLGRVGTVLARALHENGYTIKAVSSRDPHKARALAAQLGAVAAPPAAAAESADLTILAVSDDAIEAVTASLAAAGAWQAGKFVVHVSGASPAGALHAAAEHGAIVGSFHPFAAIASADSRLPPGLTFGVEAPPPLHEMLWQMAVALGGQPLALAPGDKTLYHAAAVIASNYTVTLTALAASLLHHLGAGGDQALHALLPLMRTTLDNLERQGLPAALTGPLVRGDVGTVQRHLLALDAAEPLAGELYRCLAHGTLPLAQARGLSDKAAGALHDAINLPGELLLEQAGT